LRINEEAQYVEIEKNALCSDKDQAGGIVVTDLLNYTFPLVRYSLRDIGRIDDKIRCESGHRYIEVYGRQDNCLFLQNSKIVPEKKICEMIYSDSGIAFFSMKIGKERTDLTLVKGEAAVDENAVMERLSRLGLGNIHIRYEDSLANRSYDKPRYVTAETGAPADMN